MNIKETIEKLSRNLDDWESRGLNESQVYQSILLPILQSLGWDISNPFEVVPQSSENQFKKKQFPDCILAVNKIDRLVIEVKALNKKIDSDDRAQAISYANRRGLRWALLTNGRTWEFLDDRITGKPDEKKVVGLKITSRRAEEYFERLLSKKLWENPNADTKLDEETRKISQEIEKGEQLEEIIEKLQKKLSEGFTEEQKLNAAIDFALDQSEKDIAKENIQVLLKRLSPDKSEEQKIDFRDVSIVSSKFKGKDSGLRAILKGSELPAKNWRDLHVLIADECVRAGLQSELEDVAKVRNSITNFITKDGKRYPEKSFRPLSNNKFLYCNYSAKDHRENIKKLLEMLKYPRGALKIKYKSEKYELP